MRIRAHASILLTVCLVCVPPAADAQPTTSDRSVATVLFQEARDLLAKGRIDEACSRFERSQKLDPSVGTLLNVALCHEKQGRAATAWAEFNEAFADARKDGKKDQAAAAQEHMTALLPKLTRVIITVSPRASTPDGLVISLDGAPLKREAIGVGVPVDPGDHVVEARAPSRAAFRTTARAVSPGVLRVEIPELAPESGPAVIVPAASAAPAASERPSDAPPPGPQAAANPGLSTRTAVLGGVTLTTVIVGGVLGVLSIESRKNAVDGCPTRAGCSGDALDENRRAVRYADASTVAFVVAGALGLATGLSFAGDRAVATPDARAGYVGLRIGGAFLPTRYVATVNLVGLPPVVAGRYRPIRLLGRGGMGTVYEVEHVETGERLALKVMTVATAGDGEVDRFRREARIFSTLKAEGVVRVVDAGVAAELDGAPYIAMELLEGTDLAHKVRAEGPQRPDDVILWMAQLAPVLDLAHAQGITHRDLKPANLFLAARPDGPPRLKLLDFGVAKLTDASVNTVSGAVFGTPRYMAPEQARGEASGVGPPADLWSIGMIVFFLCAGYSYFESENVNRTLAKVLFDPIAPPSSRGLHLGAAFDAWFLRSCAREPAERFPTAAAQASALDDAMRGVAPRRAPPATTPSTGGEVTLTMAGRDASLVDATAAASRSKKKTAFVAVAIVACGAIAAVIVAGRSASPPAVNTSSAQAPSGAPVPFVATPSSAAPSTPVPNASLTTDVAPARPSVAPRGGVRPRDPFADQR